MMAGSVSMRGARWTAFAAGLLAAFSLVPSSAWSQTVYYKVDIFATTDTEIPGGLGAKYSKFNDASSTSGVLVFEGFDPTGASGIGAVGATSAKYLAPGDTGTPIVETVFKFFRPNPVGDGVAFLAETIEPPGVAIGVIPDAFDPVNSEVIALNYEKISWEYVPTDPAPEPLSGVFVKFGDLDGDKQRLIFQGSTVDGEGVFHLVPGTGSPVVEPIADTTTPIPGAAGAGNFIKFGDVAGDVDFAVFQGFGDQHEGVYYGGPFPKFQLNVAADTVTPVPAGAGNFKGFLKVEIDQTAAVFVGHDQDDWPGIFSFDFVTKRLSALVGVKTAVPAPGTGFIKTINALSLSDKHPSPEIMTFLATDEAGRLAAYQATTDPAAQKIQEVIAEGDVIGGKQVTSIGLGEDGLGSIAVTLDFEDQSSGVALFEALTSVPLLPRAGLTLLLLSAGLALVLSLRTRAHPA